MQLLMGLLYQPWLVDKCISEMISDWKTKVFGKKLVPVSLVHLSFI